MTRTRDADVRGFSAREIGYLSKLPAVEHVTRGRIVYAEDFKNHCVRRYLSGDSPAQIFRMAGLDSSLIGYKRIERCIARWKDTYGHDERVLGAVNDDDRFDVSRDKRWVPPVGVELPEADSSGAYDAFSPDAVDYALPRRASKRDTRGNEGIYQLIIMQQARRIDVLEHEVEALKASVLPWASSRELKSRCKCPVSNGAL